jgi:hypothetical protein
MSKNSSHTINQPIGCINFWEATKVYDDLGALYFVLGNDGFIIATLRIPKIVRRPKQKATSGVGMAVGIMAVGGMVTNTMVRDSEVARSNRFGRAHI